MRRRRSHGELTTNRHGDTRYNILNLVNFSILLFQFLGAIVNLLISSDLLERNRDPDCFTKNAR